MIIKNRFFISFGKEDEQEEDEEEEKNSSFDLSFDVIDKSHRRTSTTRKNDAETEEEREDEGIIELRSYWFCFLI